MLEFVTLPYRSGNRQELKKRDVSIRYYCYNALPRAIGPICGEEVVRSQ